MLLEFVADLKPDSHLLPKDPVQRAQARFFIETVSSKVLPQYMAVFMRGEPPAALLQALGEVQALLPAAGFVGGAAPSIADLALLPFLARGEVVARHALVPGGAEVLAALQEPGLARLWAWYGALKARPSFVKTFDEVREGWAVCGDGCVLMGPVRVCRSIRRRRTRRYSRIGQSRTERGVCSRSEMINRGRSVRRSFGCVRIGMTDRRRSFRGAWA